MKEKRLRSTYGPADMNLSRSTAGGGLGTGTRGHRGKIGYPVPAEMYETKNEIVKTFIALKVPEKLAETLALDDDRAEDSDNLHVTILYTKSLTKEQANFVVSSFSKFFQERIPIKGKLGGFGRFSASESSDGKDVIYLSVDSNDLLDIRNEFVSFMNNEGIDFDESHAYTPHVTLMYIDVDDDTPFRRVVKPIDVIFTEFISNIEDIESDIKVESKGIPHIDDLKPDEFIEWIGKYVDLPIKGGLEVIEKVDGSADLQFGVENGKLWTRTKFGRKMFDVSEYPDKPMFTAIRNGHAALQSKEREFIENWPDDVQYFKSEVLFTKVPNSIEYGPNVMMLYGAIKDDGSDVVGDDMNKLAGVIIGAVGKLVGEGTWRFEYQPKINPKDLMVDVKKEFETVKEIYDELKKLEQDKHRKDGKVAYMATLYSFKSVQKAVKDKLAAKLSSVKPAYGPEGGDVEGAIFRDLDTGKMSKLVDKDYFTKLNKFMWYYRELMDKGVKKDEEWVPGVLAKFKKRIADDVIGAPVFKTPGIIKKISSLGDNFEVSLKNFVKKNASFSADFISDASTVIDDTIDELLKLKNEWNADRKGTIKVKSAAGREKEYTRPEEVAKRTDDAFDFTEKLLRDMKKAFESLNSINDDVEKKIAFVSIVLGDEKLAKLKDSFNKVNEDDSRAAFVPTQSVSYKSSINRDIQMLPDSLAKLMLWGQKAKEISKRLGIDVYDVKKIGVGTRGVAYDLGNGRVLKITGDNSEAKASMRLKNRGSNLKHVSKIFDVFKVKVRHAADPQMFVARVGRDFEDFIFFIVQEKLEKLSGAEKIKLTNALKKIDLIHSFHTHGTTERAFRLAIADAIDTANDIIDKEEGKRRTKEVLTAANFLMDEVHLPNMIKELDSIGIDYIDYHPGNIMKRSDGTYVVIDLGYSYVTGDDEQIDIVEKTDSTDATAERGSFGATIYIDKSMLKRRGHAIANRLNISYEKLKTLKKLGDGAQGTVYDLGDGRVVKVTNDEREAEAALRVMKKGKNLKHVVKIFDVFKIKYSFTNYGFSQYYAFFTVQEKLTKSDVDFWTWDTYHPNSYDSLKLNSHIKQANGDLQNILKLIREHVKKYIKMISPKKRKEHIEMIKGTLMFLKKINLFDMIKELKSIGIVFSDYHAGNMMQRSDGTYVVIDLGFSTSPESVRNVDLVEKYIEACASSLLRENINETAMLSSYSIDRFGDKLANRLDITIEDLKDVLTRYLGSGSYGTAYSIGDGRVLKVTWDEKEAKSSMRIMKKGSNLKHIIKIFDVFKIATNDNGKMMFFIIQEVLRPVDESFRDKWYDDYRRTITSHFRECIQNSNYTSDSFIDQLQSKAEIILADPRREECYHGKERTSFMHEFKEGLEFLKSVNIFNMIDELHSIGIQFYDYHPGNIMRRKDGTYVVTDIGVSRLTGNEDIELVEKTHLIEQNVTDKVGVVIGRFQPFHRDHAKMIRDLASRYDRVIVFIAGNKKSEKNPFSFDLRDKIMRYSLPDVENKLEVYKAEVDGKETGYIPALLSYISANENSAVKEDTFVEFVVGPDRLSTYEQQIEREAAKQAKGDTKFYDASLINVVKNPFNKSIDDESQIRGTAVRKALVNDSEEEVKKMLDPHIISDISRFREVYDLLRKELNIKESSIVEDLSSIGDRKGVEAIVNSDFVKNKLAKKGIDISLMSFLGNGQMGIAYHLSDGRVLKITSDIYEARASFMLKGKNLRHIIKIHDVFEIPVQDEYSKKFSVKQRIFCIIRDYGKSLDELDENNMFDSQLSYYYLDVDGPAWNEVKQADFMNWYKKCVLDMIKDAQMEAQTKVRMRQTFKRMKLRFDSIVKHFQIKEIFEELKSLGISFWDWKSANVVKKLDGRYAILELSVVRSSAVKDPPMLEKFIDEIFQKKLDELSGGNAAMFTAPGSSMATVRGDSTGWSKGKQLDDEEVDGMWQLQLKGLQANSPKINQ